MNTTGWGLRSGCGSSGNYIVDNDCVRAAAKSSAFPCCEVGGPSYTA